ncbi:hypothetical protein [Protofrankia coriariae]|uniref:hypothetical protein n=1 Tax=Protofrankia coriariae TaxID=1562887 RepID=UPI0012F6A625|nr:hypothetical protein [Protofrankia coriariae]
MRRSAVSPNEQLRAARLRTGSAEIPGEPLSRQELAERVNRWTFHRDGRITEVDGNYIGKLERGVIRWPQRCYREALRAILRVETDRDLGFHRPARNANGGTDVDRQQFLRAAAVVSATAALPVPGTTAGAATASAEHPEILNRLRAAVTTPAGWRHAYEPTPTGVTELACAAREAHRRYQAAEYDAAAALLPGAVTDLDGLTVDVPAFARAEDLHTARSITYLAAAKLASKLKDHDLAWVCADRAAQSALTAHAPALAATAHRQIACVFHETGRWQDAERISLQAAETLTRTGDGHSPDVLSARGALFLLAAMTAAHQGDRAEARRRLAYAAEDAKRLGGDGNRLWSGFGPTNVALHALGVSLACDAPTGAVEIGNRIDTSALPSSLVGRRAQVHVDVADAHARLRDDATATVHVLEIERLAPQVLRFHAQARDVVGTMLRRACGSTFPVLRGVADRAGIAA